MIKKHKSTYHLWEFIDTCQMISIMTIINIHRMSGQMSAVYKTTSYATLSFIPKVIESLIKKDCYYSTEILYDKAITHPLISGTSIIGNLSTYFILIVILVVFYGILKGLRLSKNTKVKERVTKILKLFEYSVLIRTAELIEYPIFLCAWMQLRSPKLGINKLEGIGVLLSILLLISGIIYICAIILFIMKNRAFLNSTEYKQTYGELYLMYDSRTRCQLTKCIKIAKKILISSLVMIPQKPLVQAFILFSATVFYILWTIIVHPQKEKQDFLCSVVSDIGIVFATVVVIFMCSATVFIHHYDMVNIFGAVFLLIAVIGKVIPCIIAILEAMREKIAILPIMKLEDTFKALKNAEDSMINESKLKDDTNDKTLLEERDFRTTNQRFQKIVKL